MTAPIEVTTRYATSVEDLPSAWQFVMAYVDRVGARPHIEINPISVFSIRDIGDDSAEPVRSFEVVVSGMVEEER